MTLNRINWQCDLQPADSIASSNFGKPILFISSASYCTIAYYIEMMLKNMGIHKPEKTQRTREILNIVLDIVNVADINHSRVLKATNDPAFTDFEDRMQYQCALKSRCDAIVTFNQKDYKDADQSLIKVFSLKEFLTI